jgi:hypothetical protein
MEHSVLGKRWVYAGMGDPVFRQRLDDAIATAGTSAKQYRVDEAGNRGEEITEVAHAFGTGPLPGAGDVEMLYQLNLDSPLRRLGRRPPAGTLGRSGELGRPRRHGLSRRPPVHRRLSLSIRRSTTTAVLTRSGTFVRPITAPGR